MSGRALVLWVAAASIAVAIAWLALRADSDASVVARPESVASAATGSVSAPAELERPTSPSVDRAEVLESSAASAAEPLASAEPVAPADLARISGRVIGPDGEPWPHADVRAERRGPSRQTGIAAFVGRLNSDKSGEDGRFTLEVEAGTVRIQASTSGLASSAVFELELAPGEERDGLTLALGRGGTIEGILLDSQDRPRGDAAVDFDFSAAGVRLGTRRTTTSVDGTFRILNVPPGPVSVSARGDRDWNQVSRVRVTVEEGQVVRVRLGGRDEGDLIVTGTVRAKSPVAGAQIVFLAEAHGIQDRDRYRTAKTDAAGCFEIRLAHSGRYVAQVVAEGLARLRRTVHVPASGTVVDFDLPSARVSGRVLDPAGVPVANVSVLLGPGVSLEDAAIASDASTTTDEAGRFAFEGVQAGAYEISTDVDSVANPERSAYANALLRNIQVEENGAREGLELRLTEGATLLVRVLAPDGRPAAGARVMCTIFEGQDRGGGMDVDVDQDGKGRIEGIATGSVELFAHTASATVPQKTRLDVRAGEPTEVTLQLVPGTILLVRALDSSGGRRRVRDLDLHVLVIDAEDRDWSHQPPGLHSWSARAVGPVPEGDYIVDVAFGSKWVRERVHVAGGKDQEVVVREPD